MVGAIRRIITDRMRVVSSSCGRGGVGGAGGSALWCSLASFFVQFAVTPNPECMRFYVDGQRFLPPSNAATLAFDASNQHLSPLAELLLTSLPMIDEVTIGSDFVTVRRLSAESFQEKIHEAAESHPPPSPPSSPPAVHNTPTPADASIAASPPVMETAAHRQAPLDDATIQQLMAAMEWTELNMSVSAVITDHLYSGVPHVALDAPHPHQDTLPCDGDSEVVASLKELIAEHIRPELQKDGGDIRFLEYRPDRVVVVELLGSCKSCRSAPSTLQDLIERTVKHWIPEVAGIQAMVSKTTKRRQKRRKADADEIQPTPSEGADGNHSDVVGSEYDTVLVRMEDANPHV